MMPPTASSEAFPQYGFGQTWRRPHLMAAQPLRTQACPTKGTALFAGQNPRESQGRWSLNHGLADGWCRTNIHHASVDSAVEKDHVGILRAHDHERVSV